MGIKVIRPRLSLLLLFVIASEIERTLLHIRDEALVCISRMEPKRNIGIQKIPT